MAAPRIPLAALCAIEITTGENIMKIKGLVFISCLAAGALIASPALSKPVKKPASSSSRSQQTAARTTQVTSTNRVSAKSAKRKLARSQHAILPRNPLQCRALLRWPPIQRHTLLQRHATLWRGNTYYGARATITAVDLTRITAITRVGRIRTGATAHLGILPVLLLGRLSVQLIQQLLHANIRL